MDRCQRLLVVKQADEVLEDYRCTSLPVDPFAIAQGAGIAVQVKETPEPGVPGCLMRVGERFGILYATHLANDGFIRFTVAHELGHYFLPGHPERLFHNGVTVHQSRSGFISADPLEQEADLFAASLLMPRQLFVPALRRAGAGFRGIEELSSLCRTSLTSTAIRYAETADDPVAVVVSSGGAVGFCVVSDRLRDIPGVRWLQPGSPVARQTPTWRFHQDRLGIQECRRLEEASRLDDWFDDAPDLEVEEDVVGLGSYGKALTVLRLAETCEEEDEQQE